ncbi:MAG: hypothetical protein RL477_2026 [Pseudomonadota bacterium]
MAKAVFTTRINSSYKDVPERWYHFPKMYLDRVKQVINDFIIYYEPEKTGSGSGRKGRKSYFAVARVTGIRPDLELDNHYYADVAEYLNFDWPVSFRHATGYYERSLTRGGAFQSSVRILPDYEFDAILNAGFSRSFEPWAANKAGFSEEAAAFERPIVEQVVSRPFRDAKFSAQVRSAYHSTCALTGLCIINGGGRPEVDAAHIQPVGEGHNRPDSVRNGLALSKTVHWMFDRGLVSVTDDFRIIAAEKLIPEPALRLLNADGQAILPDNPIEQPHPSFLKYHRDHIFKG